MKKWLTLSLALVAAAVTQAVTVAWTVPNSDYNVNGWARNSDGTPGYTAYFVYSEAEITNVSTVYDMAMQGASDGTVVKAYSYKTETSTVGTEIKNTLYGDGLLPAAKGTTVEGSGYYYMIVINDTANTDGTYDYAVAGTPQEVVFAKDSTSGAQTIENGNGVYANVAGSNPEAMTYFDMTGWLGGTWDDAMVPEPTVLALLAFGVAGVALRRKKNFTK